MNAAKRAVIYTRVSRDDTGEGKSNQRQEADCRTLAQLRGWTVVGVEEDLSISAYSGKSRPGWQRVLDLMRAGEVDIVLAWHMDRITRTVKELTDLIAVSRDTGVGIATVNGDIDLSNDTGKMVATILGAVAEAEVERKGARQKAANAQRRAEGKRWAAGWRPFGYELDGTIVPHEAQLIRQAAQDVLDGTPLREIARRWKEAGVSTPRSEKGAAGWTHHGVRTILLNPRNAALNTYKGEVVGAGDWEAIFEEETHIRLKARLTDPARKTNGTAGRSPANLLSGIAICDTCEASVTAGTVGRTVMVDGKRKSTGERIPVYKCPNDHLSTEREDADAIVVTAFAAAVLLDVRSPQLMPLHRKGADAQSLQLEAQRLNEEIKALATSFAKGGITLDQMEIATSALRARLEAVESEIAEGQSGEEDARVLIRENVDRWLDLDTAARRRILSRVARIRLYAKGRGRKNVPTKHQVTMDLVTYWKDGSERIIPALNERPVDAPVLNSEQQQRRRARPVAERGKGQQ